MKTADAVASVYLYQLVPVPACLPKPLPKHEQAKGEMVAIRKPEMHKRTQ